MTEIDENYFEFYERKKSRTAPWLKTAVFFAVIWLVMNLAAVFYIGNSSNIYFWDSATYWDISRGIASGKINAGAAEIYRSVAEQDYNYIAGIPGAWWAQIFAQTRMAYVLGLVNMYLMPAVVMIYLTARRLSKGVKLASVFTVLLIPALVFMTFIGFADVGGMLPCMLCMYLYFTRDEKKVNVIRSVITGLLLVFVLLWRRWYAFFAVSFLTAMIADALIFRKRIWGAMIAAAVSGAVLLIFFRDLVFTRLIADYGDLYSGYKFELSTDLKLVTRYFGVLTLLALAAGSVAAGICKREKRTVFLWIQMLVCFLMFTSTQTHGQQHLLLYVPALAMMLLILINHINKLWMLAALAVLSVINSVNPYIPRTQPNSIREIKHYAMIPDFSMRPIQRGDIDDILKLKAMLDNVIGEGETLGVLSSSFTLNEDILINAEASMGMGNARTDYIRNVPQVDSRDKDLTPLYTVSYMLVATPAQTHLAPESQRVVTEAVRSFEAYADIATCYRELPEYEMNVGAVTVKLYKRISDVPLAEKTIFEKRLAGE